eukprot:scaffold61806_cov67-Phaeocystis_antarctica.AAC.7
MVALAVHMASQWPMTVSHSTDAKERPISPGRRARVLSQPPCRLACRPSRNACQVSSPHGERPRGEGCQRHVGGVLLATTQHRRPHLEHATLGVDEQLVLHVAQEATRAVFLRVHRIKRKLLPPQAGAGAGGLRGGEGGLRGDALPAGTRTRDARVLRLGLGTRPVEHVAVLPERHQLALEDLQLHICVVLCLRDEGCIGPRAQGELHPRRLLLDARTRVVETRAVDAVDAHDVGVLRYLLLERRHLAFHGVVQLERRHVVADDEAEGHPTRQDGRIFHHGAPDLAPPVPEKGRRDHPNRDGYSPRRCVHRRWLRRWPDRRLPGGSSAFCSLMEPHDGTTHKPTRCLPNSCKLALGALPADAPARNAVVQGVLTRAWTDVRRDSDSLSLNPPELRPAALRATHVHHPRLGGGDVGVIDRLEVDQPLDGDAAVVDDERAEAERLGYGDGRAAHEGQTELDLGAETLEGRDELGRVEINLLLRPPAAR